MQAYIIEQRWDSVKTTELQLSYKTEGLPWRVITGLGWSLGNASYARETESPDAEDDADPTSDIWRSQTARLSYLFHSRSVAQGPDFLVCS